MHPDNKKPVTQKVGRWGPFVQHGKLMATLPKGTDPDTVTLEMAIELLAAKAAREGRGAKKKATPKKKKAPAKKKAAAEAANE
jgi:DNA topoisomerase-1